MMKTKINEPQIFFEYAKEHFYGWERLIDHKIFHNTFGWGRIIEFHGNTQDMLNSIVSVDFSCEKSGQKDIHKFSISMFKKEIINQIEIPDDISAEFNQFKNKFINNDEYKNKKSFFEEEIQRCLADARLMKETEWGDIIGDNDHYYKINGFNAIENVKLLYHFLSDIDPNDPKKLTFLESMKNIKKGIILDQDQLEYLKENSLFPLLALFNEIQASKNIWQYAVAGDYWCKAGYPKRALFITEKLHIENNLKQEAFVHFVRGQAFRDIRQLSSAEKCCMISSSLDPNDFRTFILLGAIYFQKGEPRLGDNYFKEAHRLGAPDDLDEREIRKSLGLAEYYTRKDTVAFLLNKDSEKFCWAKKYLPS